MTPGARVHASIEILTEIMAEWSKEGRGRPADGVMANYFKNRRYVGSKDRASVATLVYQILRSKASIAWAAEQAGLGTSPRALVIAVMMARSEYKPAAIVELFEDKHTKGNISEKEFHALGKFAKQTKDPRPIPESVALNVPQYWLDLLKVNFGKEWRKEVEALNEEATVDLRTNLLKTTREKLTQALRLEGFEPEPTPLSPIGLRLNKRAAISASQTFKNGWFEVQDEGSQLVSLLCDAKPGDRVVDFCAGAGGKTLALAAAMNNKGKILAFDTSEKRLKQTTIRLRRAGVDNVQLHTIADEKDKFLKRHENMANVVLVDAPCSGTGTWRRNPDMKWRTSLKDIEELTALQASILKQASKLVKIGGRLVYATCSLLEVENNQQVSKFLVDNPNFRVVAVDKLWNKLFPQAAPRAGDTLQLTPHRDGTDGFFACVFERVA